jgi:hypothetical protein
LKTQNDRNYNPSFWVTRMTRLTKTREITGAKPMNKTSGILGLLTTVMAGTFSLATNAQSFLTNGLVAYYPFSGNANDATGNNDGTPSNVSFVTDRFGNTNHAVSLSGNSDSFITINTPNLNLNFPFTVSAWVQFDSSVSGRIVSTSGYELNINSYLGAGMNVTDVGNAGASVESGQQLPFGVWQQILGVWDTNGLMSLYINGLIANTNSTSLHPDYSRAFIPTIGRNSGSSADSFPGLVDDIRIYSRAFSDGEVQQLYAVEAPPHLNIRKAVYLDAILKVGTNYQLQLSRDLNTWTNSGTGFIATNAFWRTTNYWDVGDWGALFFRLQTSP